MILKKLSDVVRNIAKHVKELNLTFKTYLTLPIDVGKAAIGVGGQTQSVG